MGAATVAAARASEPPSVPADYQYGRDLFRWAVDLQERIVSHLADLPAELIRCANCHAVAQGPGVPRSRAPRLTRELLLGQRARRGGPASAYDPESFCVLLQKGVDPAFIVISVQMPRYQMDAAACQALWRFLTADPHEPTVR